MYHQKGSCQEMAPNVSEAAVCLEKVLTLLCRHQPKLITKTEPCQMNGEMGTVLILSFVADLTCTFPFSSFLLKWIISPGPRLQVYKDGFLLLSLDVTGHNCSFCLTTKCTVVQSLPFTSISGCFTSQRSCDYGNAGRVAEEALPTVTIKYSCVPTLSTYHWRHEDIQNHSLLNSPELLAAFLLFPSLSPQTFSEVSKTLSKSKVYFTLKPVLCTFYIQTWGCNHAQVKLLFIAGKLGPLVMEALKDGEKLQGLQTLASLICPVGSLWVKPRAELELGFGIKHKRNGSHKL